jgi:NitT/TauT family transport system permease protein
VLRLLLNFLAYFLMMTTLPTRTRRYLKPSLLWGIRQSVPLGLQIGLPLLGLAIPLVIWSVISWSGGTSTTFLPPPHKVLEGGLKLWQENLLIWDILASNLRVLGGFIVAAMIGVPLGIAIGTFGTLEWLSAPITGTMRYMPVNAFVPLIMLWVGIGEDAKVLMVFLSVFFYIIIMTADAVKFIPDDLLNVSYTLGATRRDVLLKTILPAVLPSVLDTLRVNIAGAWNLLIVAEVIASQNGLGYRIIQSQRYVQADKMLFCIIIIGLIGLLTDFIFRRISIWLTPWAEHSRA